MFLVINRMRFIFATVFVTIVATVKGSVRDVDRVLLSDPILKNMVDDLSPSATREEANAINQLLDQMGNLSMRMSAASDAKVIELMEESRVARRSLDGVLGGIRQRMAARASAATGAKARREEEERGVSSIAEVLDADSDIRTLFNAISGIWDQNERNRIFNELEIIGSLLKRMTSLELSEKLMPEVQERKTNVMGLMNDVRRRLERVRIERAQRPEVDGVGILPVLSDQCVRRPFREQMLARLEEFRARREYYASGRAAAAVQPPIPLDQMKPDDAIAFLLANSGDDHLKEEQFVKIPRPGMLGMRNMGNTCYLSAVLQVLLHTRPFVDMFVAGNGQSVRRDLLDSPNYALSSFTRIVQQMWYEADRYDGEPITAADLLASLHQNQPDPREFIVSIQSDAHDTAGLLFESLSASGMVDVKTLFWNSVHSSRACRSCRRGYPTRTVESYELSVGIPDSKEVVSLEQSLGNWRNSKLEHMGCCLRADGYENQNLISTQRLVMIQLQRFHDASGRKILTRIDIPQVLELQVSDAMQTYRLIGIVNHIGGSRMKGHYTALVYHDLERVWLDADDRNVVPTQIGDRILSDQAYLLVYEKI
jgi:ubiquitin C-terminal hydrolase